jgi:hypothetical protein
MNLNAAKEQRKLEHFIAEKEKTPPAGRHKYFHVEGAAC